MPSPLDRQGTFVTPGERLSVIEEFFPGQGTYVDGGDIRASRAGFLLLNLSDRKITVFRPLEPRGASSVPRPGSTVIGEVSNTHQNYSLIRIWMVGQRHLSSFFTGLLHISNVGLSVKSMFNVCRPGDIVRARVISVKNRIRHLSLAGRRFGVIYAFCTACGSLLKAREDKKLICENCGSLERRKLASDYGAVAL